MEAETILADAIRRQLRTEYERGREEREKELALMDPGDRERIFAAYREKTSGWFSELPGDRQEKVLARLREWGVPEDAIEVFKQSGMVL